MNRRSFLKSILAFVTLIAALLPNAAFADSNRVTEGDVEAMFNAFTTGGRTIVYQSRGTAGLYASPIEHLFTGSIRPLPPWDEGHFCVDDWHVILIAFFDGGDQSYTREDAESILSELSLTFTLDGNELSTNRTPIKRFLEPEVFGLEEAYAFQEGKFFEPGELSLGEHFFNLNVYDPYGEFDLPITFFIDPSDSLTCIQ